MTQPLVDPQLAAFWASNPAILPQQPPIVIPQHKDHKKLEEAAVALAAAFVAMHYFMRRDLSDQNPPQLHDSKRFIKGVWRRHAPIWMQLSKPVMLQIYRIGQIEGLTEDELEAMAQSYAEDLGEYINETSADAMVQGFYTQLGQKWSEQLAWQRAAAAWGLDASQMRAYVQGTLAQTSNDPKFQILPARAQTFINQAITQRAEKLGGHESWQAMEMGKALAWMVQQNEGMISADAQKEWLTAEDEKVCPECGPLDHKRVGLREQWQTPNGNRYYAPGVHPNCRCDIKLIYPEIRNDVWSTVVPDAELFPLQKAEDEETRRRASADQPREHGRYGARPQRQVARLRPIEQRPVAEREVSPEVARIMEQLEEVVKPKEEEQLNPFAARAKEKQANPFHGQQLNPFAAKAKEAAALNPFARQREAVVNPFARQAAGESRSPFKQVVPTPLHRQLVMILINGRPTPVRADEADIDETLPWYVFAKDQAIDQEDDPDVDPEEVDSGDYRLGKTISFDYPYSDTVTTAKLWTRSPQQMFDEASVKYPKDPPYKYEDPYVIGMTRGYHDNLNKAVRYIQSNIQNIANQLSDRDLREIFENAGYEESPENPREELQMTQPYDEVQQSLMDLLERKHSQDDLVGGPNGNMAEARRIHNELEADVNHYKRHTPVVYVIPRLHASTVIKPDDRKAVLSGNYQVYKKETLHGHFVSQAAQQKNIHAVRLVYLKPVDDWEGEGFNPNADEDFWTEDDDYIGRTGGISRPDYKYTVAYKTSRVNRNGGEDV